MKNVFLSLGSNSVEREKHILSLLSDINNKAGKIISHSHVYETPPWGLNSDIPFLNMATEIETQLSPEELLMQIKDIESKYQTNKKAQLFQSRNADIDILLFNDYILTTEQLVIPHPLFHLRSFCTIPLSDIAGGFIHPVLGKKISEIALNFCTEQPIRLYLHQQKLQFRE